MGKSYRLIFILCLFLCHWIQTYARDITPWMKGEMPPQSNESYYFMVANGTGNTLYIAQKEADIALITDLTRSSGVTVTGQQIERMVSTIKDGNLIENTKSDYSYKFDIDSITIAFQIVDRWYEKKDGFYHLSVLYEVAKDPSRVIYDTISYTRNYGLRPVLQSAIIPGWGQMQKKHYLKGVTIFTLQAATIAASCIAENQRSTYLNRIKIEKDPYAIKFYQSKASDCEKLRNIFFIGSGIVYIFNIVDAIASKGKPKYANPKTTKLVLSPFVNEQFQYGLTLNINF